MSKDKLVLDEDRGGWVISWYLTSDLDYCVRRARLQIAIGESAHAGRQGSCCDDWVDAAHYVLLGQVPAQIRRLYHHRGVKWHDLARAAKAMQEAPLAATE